MSIEVNRNVLGLLEKQKLVVIPGQPSQIYPDWDLRCSTAKSDIVCSPLPYW